MGYIEQTRYATEAIITAYMKDLKEVQDAAAGYDQTFRTLRRGGYQPHDELQLLTEYFKQYFHLEDAQNEYKGKMFAITALCGALLQIAQTGISSTNCQVDGRFIGTQSIKTIIRQGRNQSVHYEEGFPKNPNVVSCFEKLDQELNKQLKPQLANKVNLAAAVVDILGWHTYEEYEADMFSLISDN